MKFGSQLKANRAPHWKFHFVDYDGLKALLKNSSHGREFTPQDEAQFEKRLLAELDKVAAFQTLKLGEVQRRIEHCECTIQQHQTPSGESSEKLTLASFVATESEINKITKDLQDLARFQRLNYTAFLKIMKKHDKHTSGFTSLRVNFMHHLQGKPFHKENFTPFVSRLSTLFNIVRTGAASTAIKARSIESSEEDEYRDHPGQVTNKTAFWVHPDNVMDLKMLILKYLPLVVYEPAPGSPAAGRSTGPSGFQLACESPVSTIYMDNKDLDLYMAQVEHQNKTETVRLRWYGSEKKHMWVEHQQKQVASANVTAASSSSTELSTLIKHRFLIKSKQVPQLLQGEADLTKTITQFRLVGQKTDSEIQEFEERTRIVQSRIKKRGLNPVVQTFVNRTTFQVPGDARVRITLDVDVAMARERTPGMFPGSSSSPRMSKVSPVSSPTTLRGVSPSYTALPGNWSPCVNLNAESYPFAQVNQEDITRFPYAILQVKTLTEPQEEVPSWVDHIAQSHLVEMVPNFAKDQHAVASLFESRVGLLPFWLSDMERDIRKQAIPDGFPRRITSFTTPESNGSISSSGSQDSFVSVESSPATSISESASPGPSSPNGKEKKEKSERSKTDMTTSTVNLPLQTTDLVVSHMEIQQLPSLGSLTKVTANKGKGIKGIKSSKRPVMSCLKKPVSYSSFHSRSSSEGELPSPTTSSGSVSSSSRGQKRVTFKSSNQQQQQQQQHQHQHQRQRHFWDMAQHWIPFVYGASITENERDLEAQHGSTRLSRRRTRRHSPADGPFTLSRVSIFGHRMTWNRMFWTCLSGLNIGMLFIGLVVALMNLGDGVGTEATSLFLIVSCLCMGTTVWAHLSRMDGDHDAEEGEQEEEYEGLKAIRAQTATSERVGLLTGLPSSGQSVKTNTGPSSPALGAFSQGKWVRTRVMPLVTFICLAVAVTFNVMARTGP
ncbi:hypothetical protein BG004_000714 [Podila humilis]|nr:hypothetical protein BG004_000714 [Podila humilis]